MFIYVISTKKHSVQGVHISSYQGVCVEAEIPPEVSELFETLRGEALRRAMAWTAVAFGDVNVANRLYLRIFLHKYVCFKTV